jgi:Chaperone of endosialidase
MRLGGGFRGGIRIGGGGIRTGGFGGMRGGGGMRVGGGGMRGGFRGGGRRSDIALKHDIELLGRLDNGIGFYRFSYNGSDKAYVGVIAQEVQAIVPDAVIRGPDGYLRVFYGKLGVPFQTYDQWIASGAHVPWWSPQ